MLKRRTFLLLLTILFIWVIVSRFTQLEQLHATLSQGQWFWVGMALLAQAAYFTVFSASYQAAFSALGISSRLPELIPVTLGSLFINVVVPAAGAGGAALFAENLSRRGKSVAHVATGVLLQIVADLSSFTLLLVPGLIFLFLNHDLAAYEVVAALILLIMTCGLSALLLIGLWRPGWVRSIFAGVQRSVGWVFQRLHRPAPLREDWAQRTAAEFNEASQAVASRPGRLLRTAGLTFGAHLLDLTSLYFIFLAFNQPVSLGQLVAGYAICILFTVVSPTPRGIGVVEGMMALVFISLGITGAAATTVVLAYRGLTFWLPMLLGYSAVQRLRTFSPTEHTLTETWGVRIAAYLVGLMGIVNVLSAVTPALAADLAVLERYTPLVVRTGSRLTAALAGFALLMLARGLGRRKQAAWLTALVVLAISAVSHLLKGLDIPEALFALGLMVMLLVMWPHFHARSDRASVQQGLRVLAGAFLFTLGYGVLGFFLLDTHYSVNFGFFDALRQTVIMFTQFYDPGLTPLTPFGRYFADSIYLIGAVTFGYAGWMLLRPVLLHEPATPVERARAREIVERYGRSSLAPFLLFDDKRYFFSEGGSVIGYALVGRTAVALGDPVGPESDLPSAIQEFNRLCQKNDWLPVFYQTRPDTLPVYRQAGFETLKIGNEAIVDLEAFTLEGGTAKNYRNAVNKLSRAGHRFVAYPPPLPDQVLEELRQISDEWLTEMHGTEKRFSLGWFTEEYLRSTPVGVVVTPEGWISAFANLVPAPQADEIAVDLMRRRREIESGTMEFLFVSLFQWAREHGYRHFSLGLSALSGTGEQPDAPIVERVMHFVYEHINQFYNFKGLHAFKEKFQPEWSPRYLIYPGAGSLSQAWLAVVRANSGSRFFPLHLQASSFPLRSWIRAGIKAR